MNPLADVIVASDAYTTSTCYVCELLFNLYDQNTEVSRHLY